MKQSLDVELGGSVVIEVLVCVITGLSDEMVVILIVLVAAGRGALLELILLLLVLLDGDGNASTKVVEIGRLGV